MNKETRTYLKFLFGPVISENWLLPLALVLSILFALLNTLFYYFLWPFSTQIFQTEPALKTSPVLIGIFFSFLILKAVIAWLEGYISEKAINQTTLTLRQSLYRQISHFGSMERSRFSSGEILAIFFQDILVLAATLRHFIFNFLQAPLTLVGLIAILFTLNYPLALLVFLIYAGLILIMKTLGNRIFRASGQLQESYARSYSGLSDDFRGMKTIQLFNIKENRLIRYLALEQEQNRLKLSLLTYEQSVPILLETAVLIGFAAILSFQEKAPEVSRNLAFFAAALALYLPIKQIGGIYNAFQRSRSAFARVNLLLNLKTPPASSALTKVKAPAEQIAFHSVSFQYPQGFPVLENLSLTVKRGDKVGIIGRNGAGKSTLADLLMGFLSPTSGWIEIDGLNLALIDKDSWRDRISSIPQENFFFNDTIYQNLLIANPNATLEAMTSILDRVNLRPFIEKLPNGLDTLLEEDGQILSGGFKERLALARIFLRNPDILVLDEFTSELDRISETQVLPMIFEQMPGKTIWVISQKSEMLQYVDYILHIEAGRAYRLEKNAVSSLEAILQPSDYSVTSPVD